MKCDKCYGTGKCIECNGSGRNTFNKSNYCSFCIGSGKCADCGGTGEIPDEEKETASNEQ